MSTTIDQLYRLAAQGDHNSEQELFRYLIDRFRLLVQLRIRNRGDREDVVQNALLVVADKYKSVDIERSFAAWALKVLENKIGDYYKVQRRRDSRIDGDSSEMQTVAQPHLDPLRKRQMLDCLKKVGRSNGRFARILNLHYQGYSADEVCAKLELKKAYYYVVLSRARSMLEACLDSGEVSVDE